MGAFDFAFSNSGIDGIRYSSPGFSASYTNSPFRDFFYFNGWEEILMFGLVFLIGFVVSYIGLKRFFTEDLPPGYYPNKAGAQVYKNGGKQVNNHNALLVLSLSIAALMTLGLLRNGWLFYYLGDIAGLVMSIIVMMVLVVILAPFYKAIEKAIGYVAAGVLMGPAIWFMLRIFTPHFVFFQELLTNEQLFRDFLGIPGLFVLIVVFLIIGIIRNARNKP